MIQAALQTMSGVGLVSVEVTNDDTGALLCTSVGNQFMVTFLTVHGQLPLITVAQTGTKYNCASNDFIIQIILLILRYV